MNQSELYKILGLHRLWLSGDPSGEKANLSGATLSEVNLSGANLSSATLRSADLRSADLRRAYLCDADLRDTEVYTFTLGRDFGFAHFGDQYPGGSYVKIGCLGMSLEEWIKGYRDIGVRHRYPENDIQRYRDMLYMLKKWSKK